MKKVAILQSNYIPWKGYFDIINKVDEFILYDDVQYTRRDWRNRNQIITANGPMWLTIPVLVKGKYDQKIKETEISDPSWAENHWKSIQFNYNKSKYFSSIGAQLKELYEISKDLKYLSEINYIFIKKICELLNIKTKISLSMDYKIIDGRLEKLLDLCLQSGASSYLSGQSAKNYLDESLFSSNGISVEWMDYTGYPEYQQLYSPFVNTVSIIDLLMNIGNIDAPKFMLSF